MPTGETVLDELDRKPLQARRVRGYRSIIWGIVLLAVLARGIYALIAPDVDPVLKRDLYYGDAAGYHILAENLLQYGSLTWDGETPTSFRMPGYPGFLAAVYQAFGTDPLLVRVLQALLGGLTVFPVAAVARRLGGDLAGILAGVGMALHPLVVYITGWLYSETLFIFFLWVGVWLLYQGLDEISVRKSVAAGFLFGAATLIRPELFLFPLFSVGFCLLFAWKRGQLKMLLIAQGIMLMVIFPWVVRNYVVHEEIVLLTTNTGAVFYGGNNARADGGYYLDVPFILPGMSEYDSNAELTRRGIEWISAHPGEFARLLPLKLIKFFSPIETLNTESRIGRSELAVNLVYWGYVVLAIGGGLAATLRGNSGMALLFALLLWFILVALLIYGGTRVALPIAPALIIMFAVSSISLLSKLLTKLLPQNLFEMEPIR